MGLVAAREDVVPDVSDMVTFVGLGTAPQARRRQILLLE
jgi:hypothetical protein